MVGAGSRNVLLAVLITLVLPLGGCLDSLESLMNEEADAGGAPAATLLVESCDTSAEAVGLLHDGGKRLDVAELVVQVELPDGHILASSFIVDASGGTWDQGESVRVEFDEVDLKPGASYRVRVVHDPSGGDVDLATFECGEAQSDSPEEEPEETPAASFKITNCDESTNDWRVKLLSSNKQLNQTQLRFELKKEADGATVGTDSNNRGTWSVGQTVIVSPTGDVSDGTTYVMDIVFVPNEEIIGSPQYTC